MSGIPVSPAAARPSRVIIYVDGFNWYFGLRTGKLHRFYWLDVYALAGNLLVPGQQLAAAKYFTSRISGPAAGVTSAVAVALAERRKRQSDYLEALGTTGLAIFFGQFLAKLGRCHACGATWDSFEEKMTDVNIATELLSDAFTDSFDTAIIVSADSDLVPPIRAIRRFFPANRVVVAFPPGRAPKALRNGAHAYLTIGHGTLGKSQLPDDVTKADGTVLKRPAKWR